MQVSNILPKASLYPGLAAEQPIEYARHDKREDDNEQEAPPRILQSRHEVHTEDAGDERGKHEDNGHGSHLFHDASHIIIDNAGVGLHGRVENVGVDIRRLAGLVHLDGDVLDEVGVEFVHGEFEFQFGEEGLVATNGGNEIGQAVLQSGESDEVFVVNAVVEVALGLFDEDADLLQALQIPYGSGEEQAENEVHRVRKTAVSLLLVRHEVNHHVRLEVADGDADILVEDDTQGDGRMRCARPHLFDVWNTQNDERPSVVVVITGALILISDIVKEVIGYMQFVKEKFLVIGCWTGHLHPAIWLPFVQGA